MTDVDVAAFGVELLATNHPQVDVAAFGTELIAINHPWVDVAAFGVELIVGVRTHWKLQKVWIS